MALTKTRTRTQTALDKLAELVANIHGELETVDRLVQEMPKYRTALEARKSELEHDRDALYLTLKQFDPELDPTEIGTLDDWTRAYGNRGSQAALRRYVKALNPRTGHPPAWPSSM